MAMSEKLSLLVQLLGGDDVKKGLKGVGSTAEKELGGISAKSEAMSKKFKIAGAGMIAAAGAMGAGLYKAGKSAAALETAVGGTEAVFGDASGAIDRFAKNAASKMGLSEAEFRTATTAIGGQLKALGFGLDESAEKAVDLTQVGADLSATFGGSTADAVDALTSALGGSGDAAEKYGIRLDAASVKARAVEMGLAASTSQVDAHAQAQAALSIIMEQSADSQGAFTDGLDTAEGAMKAANAEFENAKAVLGAEVAPIMADVAEKAAGLARGFADLNDKTGGLLGTLATWGTVGLAVGGGLSIVAGKAIEAKKALQKMTTEGKTLQAGMVKGAAAVGLGVLAWNLYRDAVDSARAASRAALSDLQGQFEALPPSIDKARQVSHALAGDIADLDSKDNAGGLAALVNNISGFTAGTQEAKAAAAEFKAQVDENVASAEALADKLGITSDAAYALVVSGRATADGLSDLGGVAGDQVSKFKDLGDGLSALDDQLRGMFDPLFKAQDAMYDLADAQQAVIDAEVEHGKGSPEWLRAQRDLARAAADSESAMLGLSAGIQDGSVSLDDAKATLQRWVEQGIITKETAYLTGLEFDGLATAAGSVPSKVSTTVEAPGLWTTAEGIRILKERIDNLPTYKKIAVSMSYFKDTGNVLNSAKGGVVPEYFAGGGGPRGTDTVPAWLTPGEFVMRRSAVDRIGVDTLSALNAGRTPTATQPTLVTTPVVVQIGDEVIARVIANGTATGARRGIG